MKRRKELQIKQPQRDLIFCPNCGAKINPTAIELNGRCEVCQCLLKKIEW